MISATVHGALRQRIVVVMAALIALAFGVDATRRLSVDAFPDVTSIQVQVATEVTGRSPDEVERLVTIPVEIGMAGLPGMTEMRSQNEPGLSIVTLVFSDDTGQYFARQLVGERLGDIRSRLPAGINPVLGPVSTALSEVYQYTLEHPSDGERALTKAELVERRTMQDWVARPLLRSVPGVAEINSTGGYVKQYQVLVDPVKLRYFGITIHDVRDALSRNNANSSGGILPQGPEVLLVRGIGLIQNLDDIRGVVLREVHSTPVYLRDVAEVKIGEEVRYGAMIKGGFTEAVGGVVMMTAGGNAKAIVTAIKARVEEINSKNMLPGGLRVVPYYDRSELVDAAVETVTKVLEEGIVLVVIVLFLFLGDIRSSVIVIVTLILTPALTFWVMNRAGMSANLMSLGGLAIAIGLMVDGSVVVVENVFSRLGHRPGVDRNQIRPRCRNGSGHASYLRHLYYHSGFPSLDDLRGDGRQDVRAPGLYHRNRAGNFAGAFPDPLAGVISVSAQRRLGTRNPFGPHVAATVYGAVGLGHPQREKTAFVAVVVFGATMALFPYLGTSFIPELREGTISPNMDRVPNIALDESIRMEMDAMKQIRKIPGIHHVVSRLGRGESPVDPAGYNESDMMIQLVPAVERPGLSQDDIAEQVRQVVSSFPGINSVMAQPIADRVDEMVTGVRADVAVKIFGDNLDVLIAKADEVARVAGTIRGTADIKLDRVSGQQNLNAIIDRQAIARYGLNAEDVHDVIEAAVGGELATEIYEGERRFQAVVRYPEQYRNSIGDIRGILVTAPGNQQVPLGSLASIGVREGLSQVKREMAKRRINVGVNVKDRDLGGFVADLQKAIETQVTLPPGYYFEWGGQFENMQRARRHLMVIVPITIGAIFFLLFVLFRSLRFATLIILVLPFASIGGVAGLYFTGEYLSVPASVGFIALWGIAVLYGVVLVSCIRNLRESGMERRHAILEGARIRFRPVMMTATVAALGLVPFLISTGPGCEVQRPLAVVVIGGLVTFTLLTLLIIPAIYRFFDGPAHREVGVHSSIRVAQ